MFFLSLIIVFVVIVIVVVVELDFSVECFKYMDIFAVLDVIMSINMNTARERRKKLYMNNNNGTALQPNVFFKLY